uniref:Plastid light harvesting protein n=1 Tax=Trieres chinensis TaxID=1514140 RepID=A0A7S2EUU8_TRICV|mmetsp:Transcript_4441/g.9387  ORF Transcript_4441/g.9387 Transcript_4441/m.9387 type:complete len:250 (+) Transcript_4441:135-884(+)
MKLALLSATLGVACAFTPSMPRTVSTPLHMSVEVEGEATPEVSDVSPEAEGVQIVGDAAVAAVAPINGWVPDETKPCYGLPGISGPLGFFDPLGFSKNTDLNGVKRFREAEVMHGRVAMMATVGYLIGESTPTITYGMNVHHTIANNQLPEVPGTVLFPFFLAINIAEALRASIGWVEPGLGPLFSLRESYYPGDIYFDPLGLKPKDAKEFEVMQTKELNNGRLAMIAAAGMCVQEQINGKGILENLGF